MATDETITDLEELSRRFPQSVKVGDQTTVARSAEDLIKLRDQENLEQPAGKTHFGLRAMQGIPPRAGG